MSFNRSNDPRDPRNPNLTPPPQYLPSSTNDGYNNNLPSNHPPNQQQFGQQQYSNAGQNYGGHPPSNSHQPQPYYPQNPHQFQHQQNFRNNLYGAHSQQYHQSQQNLHNQPNYNTPHHQPNHRQSAAVSTGGSEFPPPQQQYQPPSIHYSQTSQSPFCAPSYNNNDYSGGSVQGRQSGNSYSQVGQAPPPQLDGYGYNMSGGSSGGASPIPPSSYQRANNHSFDSGDSNTFVGGGPQLPYQNEAPADSRLTHPSINPRRLERTMTGPAHLGSGSSSAARRGGGAASLGGVQADVNQQLSNRDKVIAELQARIADMEASKSDAGVRSSFDGSKRSSLGSTGDSPEKSRHRREEGVPQVSFQFIPPFQQQPNQFNQHGQPHYPPVNQQQFLFGQQGHQYPQQNQFGEQRQQQPPVEQRQAAVPQVGVGEQRQQPVPQGQLGVPPVNVAGNNNPMQPNQRAPGELSSGSDAGLGAALPQVGAGVDGNAQQHQPPNNNANNAAAQHQPPNDGNPPAAEAAQPPNDGNPPAAEAANAGLSQELRDWLEANDYILTPEGSLDISSVPGLEALVKQVQGCPFVRKLFPDHLHQVFNVDWLLPSQTQVNGEEVGVGMTFESLAAWGRCLSGLTMQGNQPFTERPGSAIAMPTLMRLVTEEGKLPYDSFSPYLNVAFLILGKAVCDWVYDAESKDGTGTTTPWLRRGGSTAAGDFGKTVALCSGCGRYTCHDPNNPKHFIEFISLNNTADAKYVVHLTRDGCGAGFGEDDQHLIEAIRSLYAMHRRSVRTSAAQLRLKDLLKTFLKKVYNAPVEVQDVQHELTLYGKSFVERVRCGIYIMPFMEKVDGIKIVFTHPFAGICVFSSGKDNTTYVSGEVEICVLFKNISCVKKHPTSSGYYCTNRVQILFDTACDAALNRDIQTKEKNLISDLAFENEVSDMPEYSIERRDSLPRGWYLIDDKFVYNDDGSPESFTSMLGREKECDADRCLTSWCGELGVGAYIGYCGFCKVYLCPKYAFRNADHGFVPEVARLLEEGGMVKPPFFDHLNSLPQRNGVKCAGKSGGDIVTFFTSNNRVEGTDLYCEQDDDFHRTATHEKEYKTMENYMSFTAEAASRVMHKGERERRYAVCLHTGQVLTQYIQDRQVDTGMYENQANMLAKIYSFLHDEVNFDTRLIDRHWVIYVDYHLRSVGGNRDHVTHTLKQFAKMHENVRPRVSMIKSEDWRNYSDVWDLLQQSEVTLDEYEGVVSVNE